MVSSYKISGQVNAFLARKAKKDSTPSCSPSSTLVQVPTHFSVLAERNVSQVLKRSPSCYWPMRTTFMIVLAAQAGTNIILLFCVFCLFHLLSFLNELRNIAVNSRLLSNGTVARLKKAPVLLAAQRRALTDEKAKKEVDGDEDLDVYDLKRPDQIVIADDSNALQLFGDQLWTAPQEEILEGMHFRSFFVHTSSESFS